MLLRWDTNWRFRVIGYSNRKCSSKKKKNHLVQILYFKDEETKHCPLPPPPKREMTCLRPQRNLIASQDSNPKSPILDPRQTLSCHSTYKGNVSIAT